MVLPERPYVSGASKTITQIPRPLNLTTSEFAKASRVSAGREHVARYNATRARSQDTPGRKMPYTPRSEPWPGDEGKVDSQRAPDDLLFRSLLTNNYTRLDSYADLEDLERLDGPPLGFLASSVKQRLLGILRSEMEPITEVGSLFRKRYPDWADAMNIDGLCLGGVANCVDFPSLYSSLYETRHEDFAVLTIHPDDWVAGRAAIDPEASWMKHGKMIWTIEPVTNPEDISDGLTGSLLLPSTEAGFARPPSAVDKVLSPVVDQYLVELEDTTGAPIIKFFPNACRFLDTHLAVQERKVLVHCKAGKSRGPAFTLAFMIHRYCEAFVRGSPEWRASADAGGIQVVVWHLIRTMDRFMEFLADVRPCISADNKFRSQLHLWCWRLVGARGPELERPEEHVPGGGDMRDAAIIEFYLRDQRPFPNLVAHWKRKRVSGMSRWSAAEREKARRDGWPGKHGPGIRMQDFIERWEYCEMMPP